MSLTSWGTKTLRTVGGGAGQGTTSRFQRVHWEAKGSGTGRPAGGNGRRVRARAMPRQRFAAATAASPVRQWAAWLSPISANVLRARFGDAPNAHGSARPSAGWRVHGAPRSCDARL